MKLFLTSSIGGSYKKNGVRIPCEIDGSNHLLELLKEYWPKDPKCLILSSDPENEEMNDSFRNVYSEAFNLSNLPLPVMHVCDRRNEGRLADLLYDYNVVLLSGGHVPTQNRFFNRIHLKELMRAFKGIVIGISAGSMNCAEVVYAQPESDGEATDPRYERYLEGLHLTNINILPHFQEIKNLTLDGFRILEDISLPDSKKRPFYALADGSYILVDDNKSTLYGEAYWIEDGTITKICDSGQKVQLVYGAAE